MGQHPLPHPTPEVRVRDHTRRYPAHRARPESARGRGQREARERFSFPQTFDEVVDSVVSGRRSGYTWTENWKFDVGDLASMSEVYSRLGGRTIYVIASTNRTLEDYQNEILLRDIRRPGSMVRATLGNQGVGVWRDDDGTIYVDEIYVYEEGPGHWEVASKDDAIRKGREHNQKSILRVDGATRSFEFINTRAGEL